MTLMKQVNIVSLLHNMEASAVQIDSVHRRKLRAFYIDIIYFTVIEIAHGRLEGMHINGPSSGT